jgi:hypothetical protein
MSYDTVIPVIVSVYSFPSYTDLDVFKSQILIAPLSSPLINTSSFKNYTIFIDSLNFIKKSYYFNLFFL